MPTGRDLAQSTPGKKQPTLSIGEFRMADTINL